MFTMADLTIVPEIRDHRDSSIWERVTVSDGRKFLVGSCDLSGDKIENADPESQLLFLLGALPEAETWVMEAVEEPNGDWTIKYQCNEECKTGVCKKRLASDRTVASQEHGYNMLLDALNA